MVYLAIAKPNAWNSDQIISKRMTGRKLRKMGTRKRKTEGVMRIFEQKIENIYCHVIAMTSQFTVSVCEIHFSYSGEREKKRGREILLACVYVSVYVRWHQYSQHQQHREQHSMTYNICIFVYICWSRAGSRANDVTRIKHENSSGKRASLGNKIITRHQQQNIQQQRQHHNDDITVRNESRRRSICVSQTGAHVIHASHIDIAFRMPFCDYYTVECPMLGALCPIYTHTHTHILQVLMLSIVISNVLENCLPFSLSFLFLSHFFDASSDNDDDSGDFDACMRFLLMLFVLLILFLPLHPIGKNKRKSKFHLSQLSNVMNLLFNALHSRKCQPKLYKSFRVQQFHGL